MERLLVEIEQLRKRYPTVQIGEDTRWLMIPEYPLPVGWNRERTRLLFMIPPEYPHRPPDNFYVDVGLKLAVSNQMPSNYSEGQCPAGGQWGCFSFHAEVWCPAPEIEKGDNVLTFLIAVRLRLQELN
jgi:hypothetical protein